MADQPTHADQLAEVVRLLQKEYPKAVFTTNADTNPATPMTIRASWGNGRILKTVRANSANSTVDEFVRKAKSILTPFQENCIPTRHLA